jgi:peptidoglycan/LPS O-acetylase OafA/YrhL
MDVLATGGLLALIARGPTGLTRLASVAPRVVLGSVAALLALGVWRSGLFLLDPVVQILGFPLLSLCFAALLVSVVAAPLGSWRVILFESFPLRWLGRYSYALYVFNSIFVLAAERLSLLGRLIAWSGSSVVGCLSYVVLGASCTFVTAWLSWHLLEKHFLALKRYFASEKVRGTAS